MVPGPQSTTNKPTKSMTMPPVKQRSKGGRQLTGRPSPASVKAQSVDRYDLANSGPQVRKHAEKLSGKIVNNAPPRTLSLAVPQPDRQVILSNVTGDRRGVPSEASVSGITSAADNYNSYRFDESSALKTYKKMMTLHLKDKMFRKIKFISTDAMLEFSRSLKTICGYVCTKMRVPNYQWGEYWELVRQPTKKMIEQQRTNATSAIKKGFKGKYTKK